MATVFTQKGRLIVSGRAIGATPTQTEAKFIGWGTGAGTAATTDTTLFTEASETSTTRVTGTGSQVTVTTTSDTHQIVGTVTATGTKTITNAGVFDATSSGNLYIKGDFTGVAVNSGDSITFTFKLTSS